MKRKMLVVTMIIAMMMASLMAACGNNGDVPANNTIIDTPTPTSEPTQTTEPTIAPDDEGVVDSGVLDDVPDEGEAENEEPLNLGMYEKTGVRLDYSMLFPTDVNAEAWLQEHRFENPDYSFYITYFKDRTHSDNPMTFTWVAPSNIGNLYWLSEDENTFHVANDNRRLVMWNGGKFANESEYLKSYDAETIMGVVAEDSPIANTYQVVEDDENTYRVIFKVESEMFGVSYIGYACFVDFFDIGMRFQFEYYMEKSIYTEAEALAVISSIEYVNLDDLEITIPE